MNKIKANKGLTLVEVVVALSIFAIVFSGTATLIISVVNLAVISKERTEAITYAQKGLALRIKSLDYGCNVGVSDEAAFNDSIDWDEKYKLTTKVEPGKFNDSGDGIVSFAATNTEPNFVKITSTINWNGKFGNQVEEISQIIRNK